LAAQEMKPTALSILKKFSGSTYIILDALDECAEAERHSISQFVQELLELEKVHILITCRFPKSSLIRNLNLPETYYTSEISLDTVASGMLADIEKHVRQFISRKSYTKSLENKIMTTLINGAHGQ